MVRTWRARLRGVVADAFEGFQDEGGLHGYLEVTGAFHCTGQQAAQAGSVFGVEIFISCDYFVA